MSRNVFIIGNEDTQSQTPSFEAINAKVKSDFIGTYGNLDLNTATMTQLATFIADVKAKQQDNNFENYAPYKGVMVRVFVDDTATYPITWEHCGRSFGKNTNGVTGEGLLDQTIYVTMAD